MALARLTVVVFLFVVSLTIKLMYICLIVCHIADYSIDICFFYYYINNYGVDVCLFFLLDFMLIVGLIYICFSTYCVTKSV